MDMLTEALDGPARAQAQGFLDVAHIAEIQARYVRGVRGKPGNKAELAAEYGVSERDIAGAAAGKRCTVTEGGAACRRSGTVIDDMCWPHWTRNRKHGSPLIVGKPGPAAKLGPKPKRDKRIYPCVDGCGRKVAAKDSRCMNCYLAKAAAEAAPKPTCADCGGPVSKAGFELCKPCRDTRRAAEANRKCTFPGCTNTDVQLRGGLCPMHDHRKRIHGDPSVRLTAGGDVPLVDIVRSRVDSSGNPDACWPYTGKVNNFGYGIVCLDGAGGPEMVAHRFLWIAEHGPVPDTVEIDHVCHNRAVERGECDGGAGCRHRRCCNLLHLRATSHAANTLAGMGPPAVNGRKTHCVRGHPFSGPGSDVRIYGNGWRRCRHCERERRRGRRSSSAE